MSTHLEPTVKPAADFDASLDAVNLRLAMRGLGTNEETIIEILVARTNAQRQAISKYFTEEIGRDIIKDLKSEISGDFKHLILALMLPPAEYLSKELNKCLEAKKPDEDTLVEILCTRTKQEVAEIADAYEKKYGKPLAEHMRAKTSGDFRRLLTLIVTVSSVAKEEPTTTALERNVSLLIRTNHPETRTRCLQGPRKDELEVDPARAKEDAKKLIDAGEKKWGTDEDVFCRILAHESFNQLRLVLEEYKKISGRSMLQVIQEKLEGELKEALSTIVESVENAPAWFAARLRKAMKGLGTDDDKLIRIIVTRSEVDLGAIKREFKKLYNETLESDIKGDTSGNYKKALIALLGPEQE